MNQFKSLKTLFATLILWWPFALLPSWGSVKAEAVQEESWGYDSHAPLITSSEQLSTNANSKECDSDVGHLLDGDISTYFHTSWSKGNGSPLPNENHYLQVHLNEAQEDIIFTFTGMDWESAHNTPQDVTILASNNPSDESSWVEITELSNMIAQPDVYPAYYTSPHIALGDKYTDIRMVVNQTTTGKTESTYGKHYFCLSEFQMYRAVKGTNIGKPQSQSAKSAVNIVFIGNSITHGETLSSPSTQAPPVIVGQTLSRNSSLPIRIRNCGVSGLTTVDWLPSGKYLNQALSAASDLDALNGRLFFSIMLGTNDSAEKGPNGAPVQPSDYKNNLKSIIDACIDKFPTASVVVNYPIWYSPTTHNSSTYLQSGLDRLVSYHPIIKELVTEYQSAGKQVYEGSTQAYDFFKENESYYTQETGQDGAFYLHPNQQGAVKLAEIWASTIAAHTAGMDSISRIKNSYSLIDSALTTIEKCYDYSYDLSTGLIQNAQDESTDCQISTNDHSNYQGKLAYLIDGDTSTLFQSDATTDTLTDCHYLLIDTKKDDLVSFYIGLKSKSGSYSASESHYPTDIVIYATNDLKNGWDRVGGIHQLKRTEGDVYFMSPCIRMDKAYRYIKLQIEGTESMALSRGGVPYFEISELQLFEGTLNNAKSAYYSVSGLSEKCDELTTLTKEMMAYVNQGKSLTEEQSMNLRDKMNAVESSLDVSTDLGSTQSPDGKNVFNLQLSLTGTPTYTISRSDKELVAASKMGISTEDYDFSTGLSFLNKEDSTINETYELPTGKSHIYVNNCNETTYNFQKDGHEMQIVVRCYNDGVAFRYCIDGSDSTLISGESSEIEFPSFNKCWGEKYVSDYSTQYPARTWAETAALVDHKLCAPLLVQSTLGDDFWVLITESAVLGNYSSSSLISGDESEVGHFSYQPEGTSKVLLPFKSPWRTLYVGQLTDIVASNLNENLNESSIIDDTSWIETGLSSWDWGGQDGSQTNDINVVKDYIDMAYEMGWPYYTLDEGWAYSSYPLKDVTDYASSKGVKVIIWSHSHRFQNDEAQIREVLSNWKNMGFSGAKIDFFDGDSQQQMQKYEKILRVAADLQMVINFHGCTKPTGLRRMFPNLLTSEAVYGGEQYFFNHLATPANHNVTLALTRNVIGAMDYTPTEFGRTDGVIRHTTTWSHQVALATLYESGIQTMSDCHENVVHNIAAPLLKILPASWDETRCLEASPDEYITMLRRKGDDWYVASISKDARTVSIPLSFLGDGDYTLQSYSDGDCPSDIHYSEQQVNNSMTIEMPIKATGGFTIRISKNPFKQPKFTLVEAESGTRTNGTTLETDNNGNCSGGKYIGYLGKGQTLTNTVSVDEEGIYDLTLYFITQDTRDCYVQVNDGEKSSYTFKGNGFSWNSDGLAFKTIKVKLQKGSNTIKFGNDNGDCPNLDRFLISPSTGFNKVKILTIENFTSKDNYTNEEPVSIELSNNGLSTLSNVKVYYKLNDSDKESGLIASISPGDTVSYTFDTKVDLSATQSYTLQVWVEDDATQQLEGDMKSVVFAHIPVGEPLSWLSKGGSIDSYSAQQNDNEAASKLLDNDSSTKWCETSNSQPWVIIKLPQSCYVQQFVMYDCKTHEQDKNVDAYDIYLSDDPSLNDWQQVVSTTNRKSEDVKVDNITSTKASYVKLVLTRPEGTNAIRVYGFDVYGTLDNNTGIISISTDKSANASDRYYSISGQAVNSNYKGLVIHNGKKYVKP